MRHTYLSYLTYQTNLTCLLLKLPVMFVLSATLVHADTRNTYNTYTVIAEAEYDDRIFTQGFDYEPPWFYMSSGRYGKSFVTREHEKTGEGDEQKLNQNLFAEGLVKVADTLYLLTWKAGKLLTFDAATLEYKSSIKYSGDGWGITYDGSHLVTSDGSAQLKFRDLASFKNERTLTVTRDGASVKQLNELEYARNAIYANVWFSTEIIKIDPQTGHVLAAWDLSNIRRDLKLSDKDAVLNGIAFDAEQEAFWITGKFWPKRFLVKLQDEPETNH